MFFYFLIYILFICFLTNFLIKYSLPLMGNIFKEVPNNRSAHKEIKLKGGGIFFILIVLISNIIFVAFKGFSEISQIIFFCTLLSLVGLVDDLFFLSSKIRYLIHLIFSFLIVNTMHPSLVLNQNYIFLVPLIFLGTVIINFINFIDGIDGLLIGCSIPILIFSQINFFNIQILTAIASMLIFLKWNWDPSKIFMGDCGSNYLGGLIFFCILSEEEYLVNFKTIFIALPILIDCSWCIIRRFLNKENIFIAHNKHLYQRLNQKGISHSNVSLIYIILCFTNFFIAFQNNINIFVFISVFEFLFLIYLDKSFAKKFI